jgi:hypothetical protein
MGDESWESEAIGCGWNIVEEGGVDLIFEALEGFGDTRR